MRVSVGGGGQGWLQEQGSMAGLGEGGGGAGWQEQGQASMARVGVGGVNNLRTTAKVSMGSCCLKIYLLNVFELK